MFHTFREYQIFIRSLAIWIFLLPAGNIDSQELQLDNYDIRDGLPSNVISDIIQDKRGYMWFATQVGVSRYDGYHFINYGIQDGLPFIEIECIMEDSQGRIWVGTLGGGIAVYENGKWSYKDKDQGLADNLIRRVFEDHDNAIWCYSDNGISRIKDNTIRTFTTEDGLSHNTIVCHWLDNANNIFAGTSNGLDLLRKNKDGTYTIGNILPGIYIICLLQDKQGILWIGTWENGIYRYDSNGLVNFTTRDGLPGNSVTCLFEDHEGNLWIGLEKAGIARLENARFVSIAGHSLNKTTILEMTEDKNHAIWAKSQMEGVYIVSQDRVRNITTQNNLPDNNVYKIMTDSDGNVWMGTGGGISKMGKKPFEIYDTDFGLPGKAVLCTHVDREGNVWGGTYTGPFRISPDGKLRKFDEKDGLPANYLTIFKITSDHEGHLWFGTYYGVTGYSGLRFHTFRNPKWERTRENVNSINDIVVDRQNKLILAEYYGICEFYKGRYFFPGIYITLADKDIRAIDIDDEDNLWVCTSEGVQVIGRNSLTITSSEGLSNNSCNDVYLDSSGISWIATDDGLNKITMRPDGSFSLSTFTVSDGLLSNSIMFVERDHRGSIWIGHEKGLSRLDAGSDRFYSYSGVDGFTPLETYLKAVSVDEYNNVWIGTVGGLVKYNPEMDKPETFPPRLYITGVKFYNDSTNIFNYASYTDSVTGLPGNLILPYNKNNFIFEYVGLHYSNTAKNRYQYKLEGYDDSWSEVLAGTITHPYQKLPHGDYTFLVKASNCDGIWSEPASYSFSIKPPIWKTGWFYALEVLFGIGLIYAFVRIRVRKLQHDKKVLAQKVKERTLEIERQRDHIAEINREITDSIMYAQRIQAAVLPDEETIKSHLKDYFILFKPRDIVSGDFYWISTKGKKIIVVAADCTGHGVPGAFMSMLGVSLLNEIVTTLDTFTAANILNQLRENIKQTLSQTGKKDEAKDGMDMALCIIDTETLEGQFAGAYNPLLLVTNNEMIVYKGDKMPIGIHFSKEYHFTNNLFQLHAGDIIYMFSDGYADQFGGPDHKKFKTNNFREMLLEIHSKSMDEQKKILDDTIEEWRGDDDQVDDIMVMGVRIS
ncbi:MAG: SpoIIE family protein phosphatase [Bacteroidales bacterium]|nr:SpoIIE family protein phosphatase [Bacteroidales bacterium]